MPPTTLVENNCCKSNGRDPVLYVKVHCTWRPSRFPSPTMRVRARGDQNCALGRTATEEKGYRSPPPIACHLPTIPPSVTVIPYKSIGTAQLCLFPLSRSQLFIVNPEGLIPPYFGRPYRPSVSRCCSRRRFGARLALQSLLSTLPSQVSFASLRRYILGSTLE